MSVWPANENITGPQPTNPETEYQRGQGDQWKVTSIEAPEVQPLWMRPRRVAVSCIVPHFPESWQRPPTTTMALHLHNITSFHLPPLPEWSRGQGSAFALSAQAGVASTSLRASWTAEHHKGSWELLNTGAAFEISFTHSCLYYT